MLDDFTNIGESPISEIFGGANVEINDQRPVLAIAARLVSSSGSRISYEIGSSFFVNSPFAILVMIMRAQEF
ncbi:hypothetical protein PT974_02000 [Cladobotryum mycophilum]|uniref:Uncharacterized protein n=1 Tax=Cladobotryum mycophilum TaxID=491253 RepID=A0ABR0SY21_9HYPO